MVLAATVGVLTCLYGVLGFSTKLLAPPFLREWAKHPLFNQRIQIVLWFPSSELASPVFVGGLFFAAWVAILVFDFIF